MIHECNRPITTNDDLRSLYRKFRMGLKYALFRRGPLAIGINQAGAFARTGVDPDRPDQPDIQFHFAALSADMPGAPLHDFSSSVCQLRPRSHGHLELRSTDPAETPAIHPNYLSDDIDRRTVVAALKVARKVADAPALAGYISREHAPGPDARSDEELLQFARETGVTIFHPSCTCRMGADPDSVVDPRLRVRGVRGLRVADCSIMPALVSGNTHAPVVMIAEKASDMILEDAAAE